METFKLIKTRLIACLLKNIYRLKQSSKLQNQKVIAFFKSLGNKAFNANSCIFVKQIDKNIILDDIYINNFLFAANQQDLLNWIKKVLQEKYNVKKLEKIKTIIGW